MSGPFREPTNSCPSCAAALREFHKRLCCDQCEGMMLALDDLTAAIIDITGGLEPAYEFVDLEPGKRACPTCTQSMATCKLRVMIDDELAKPRPVLDKCAEHGLWFDGEELAKVLEKVRSKVSPKRSPLGWKGDRSGFEWWKGGGV